MVTTREILTREELVRSEMYADYLHTRGLHEGLRLAIWSDEDGIEDISLLRPWSIGPYTAAERDLAHTLMPHLRRAVGLLRRLMRAEIASLASTEAVDRLGSAVVLLDETGLILHVNQAALAKVCVADGIKATNDRLQAADTKADRVLQQAVRAATCGNGDARSSALRLKRRSGRPDLAATLNPINIRGHGSVRAHRRRWCSLSTRRENRFDGVPSSSAPSVSPQRKSPLPKDY